MESPDAFPIVYLLGFGNMLSQFLGQPLEKAIASSPNLKVIATRDAGGFDVTEELKETAKARETIKARETAKTKEPVKVGAC